MNNVNLSFFGSCYGGDEERGRERDRYNERDGNRGWQVTHRPNRQKYTVKYRGEDRGRDSRDRIDRNKRMFINITVINWRVLSIIG